MSSPGPTAVPFISWKGRSHPSGEADEPHQPEIVQGNELPLIDVCALGSPSRCVFGRDMLCVDLRSAFEVSEIVFFLRSDV